MKDASGLVVKPACPDSARGRLERGNQLAKCSVQLSDAAAVVIAQDGEGTLRRAIVQALLLKKEERGKGPTDCPDHLVKREQAGFLLKQYAKSPERADPFANDWPN